MTIIRFELGERASLNLPFFLGKNEIKLIKGQPSHRLELRVRNDYHFFAQITSAIWSVFIKISPLQRDFPGFDDDFIERIGRKGSFL